MMMEMHSCFHACDTNDNGVLEPAEFKQFMQKQVLMMRRMLGEAMDCTDAECDSWYKAYNMIQSDKEGVSL